ncbi:MAG: Fibronectin type III domain protein [Parcubacteria bacterium C7867-007]|nr:MAG: Fibronectin type III domain protein [Parcubacteria bacterium C7867-007]
MIKPPSGKTYFIALLALFLFIPLAPADAMRRPLFGVIQLSFNTGGARFLGFDGGNASANSSGFAGAAAPQPSSGMVKNLYVSTNVPPGGITTQTVTLYRNAVATALTCTITGTASTCSNTANTIPFLEGDLLSWQQTPVGTPAASSGNISAELTYGVAKETSFSGGGATLSTTAYNYFATYGGAAFTTIASSSVIISSSGTVDKLYFQLGTAPGASVGYNAYVYHNGATSTLTCSVTGSATLQCSDLSNSISVTAGDTLSVGTAPIGAVPARGGLWGMRFKPTLDGEAPFWTRIATISNGVRYNALLGNGLDVSTEGTASTSAPIAYSIKNLYASYNIAPGGITTRNVTLRKNAASTALSATATGAETTASDIANTISVAAGDLVNWLTQVTGSPAVPSLIRISGSTYIPALTTGITVVGSTRGSGASSAPSCTRPTGTIAKDVVIAVINFNSGSAVLSDNNGSTPFTKDYTSPNYGSANMYVFSRYAGGSEPSSYVFSSSGGDRWTITCTTFRGVDVINKYDVAPSNSTFSYTGGAGGAAATSTAITTLTNGALILSVSGIDTGTATLATQMPADSFIGLIERSTDQPQNAVYKIKDTAGLQSSVSWSYAVTVLPGVITLALKSAVAPDSAVVSSKFKALGGVLRIIGGSFNIR